MSTRKTTNPSRETWRATWASRSPAVGAPTADTAAKVWKLLGLKIRPESLRPPMLNHFELTPEEERELNATARAALVVGLAFAVSKGREPGKRDQDDPKKRRLAGMVTFTHLFDALAEHWSPTFRSVRARTPARHVREMTRATAEAVKVDLVTVGIDVEKIWARVGLSTRGAWSTRKGRRRNPLYYVGRLKKAGAKVRFRDRDLVATFEHRLRAGGYQVQEPPLRLLFADVETTPISARPVRQEVCAERGFNVAPLGEKDEALLTELERTVLPFNARVFKKEYQGWLRIEQKLLAWKKAHEWAKIRRSWRIKVLARLQADLDVYGSVYDQVRDDDRPVILIKSEFQKAVNRRLHAQHFYIEHVGGKPNRRASYAFSKMKMLTSPRLRWFTESHLRNPIVGRDVSASQSQIMALLMGNRDAEDALASRKIKDRIAELLWRASRGELGARLRVTLPAMTGPGDPRLRELAKSIWTPFGYGSQLREIIRNNPELYGVAPDKMYRKVGKQWTWTPSYKKAVRRAAYQLGLIFERASREDFEFPACRLPEYKMVDAFKKLCHRIVDALPRDSGLTLRDPYSGVAFEWNPAQRADARVRFKGPSLQLSLPADVHGNEVTLGAGDPLPVSARDLKRALPPYLIHALDAFYLGLVVDQLKARNAPATTLHDCVYLPQEINGRRGAQVLEEVMQDAAVDWFQGLGGVVKELQGYLPDDPELAHALRAWDARTFHKEPVWIKADVSDLVAVKNLARFTP